MPILLQQRVGRLIESRFATPIEQVELEAFNRERAQLRMLVNGERVVVMDFRRASLLPPGLADSLVGILCGPNPGLLRNGILIPTASPTVAMQLTRIVREAKSDRRRVFSAARELAAWLGEVLDPPEHNRLSEFLADHALKVG